MATDDIPAYVGTPGRLACLDFQSLRGAGVDDLPNLIRTGVFGLDHELTVFDLEDFGERFHAVTAVTAGLVIPYDFHGSSSLCVESVAGATRGDALHILGYAGLEDHWGKYAAGRVDSRDAQL